MIKNSLILITLIITGFCASTVVLADCPKPNQIKYIQSKGNWQAPYYEGFTQGAYHGDTSIDRFIKVEWIRKNSNPNNRQPTLVDGSSLCFYRGNKGSQVMMVQNKWGGVAKPMTSNWHLGYDKPLSARDVMTLVLVCTENCHFTS